MAHSKSRRKQNEEYRLRLADQAERARPRNERAVRDAKLVVAAWNVRVIRGMPITFFPTIWAAVAARRPFLACVCPACQVQGFINLRRFIDRQNDSLEILIPALVCKRCAPTGPHVHVKGLRKLQRRIPDAPIFDPD